MGPTLRIYDAGQSLRGNQLASSSEALLKLPEKIWGAIWKALDLPALFVATHVCGTWRRFALADPTLWPTELDCRPRAGAAASTPITLLMPFLVECGPSLCTFCAGGALAGGINWDLSLALLQRSAPLPLTLSMDVCESHAKDPLAQLLRDLAGRLAVLHMHGPGESLLGEVLPALHPAPMLRSLSLVGVFKNAVTTFPAALWQLPCDVEFPALEELNLDLSPGLYWRTPESATVAHPHHLYAKLRSVTIFVRDFADMLSMLDVCPGVRAVTIPGFCIGRIDVDSVRSQAHSRFPAALTLKHTPGLVTGFPMVAEAFGGDYFFDVMSDYGTRSLDVEYDLIPFFFSRRYTELSITRVSGTDDKCLLAAYAENGLRRAIVSSYSCFMIMIRPIDAYIPHHALVAATVDWPMWMLFTGVHVPAFFPNLARLTVNVCPSNGLQRFRARHVAPPGAAAFPELMALLGYASPDRSSAFPALTALRVGGLDTRVGLAMFSPHWLAAFVAQLALDHPLERIEVPWCPPGMLDTIRKLGLAERVE